MTAPNCRVSIHRHRSPLRVPSDGSQPYYFKTNVVDRLANRYFATLDAAFAFVENQLRTSDFTFPAAEQASASPLEKVDYYNYNEYTLFERVGQESSGRYVWKDLS